MTNKEIKNINNPLKDTLLVKKTQKSLGKIWDKYQHEFKYLFGLRLFEYAQGKHYDYTTEILPKKLEERTKIINSYRKRKGASSSSKTKQVQRLTIGYNSLTLNLSPFKCNLSSKAANNNHKETTSDHIIGATLCAQYVLDVFLEGKKSNKETWENLDDWLDDRIDYMCNEWLKNHLWLWAECRITINEHKPKNGLLRNMVKETIFKEIMYRADLKHYERAKIEVAEDYKNIP